MHTFIVHAHNTYINTRTHINISRTSITVTTSSFVKVTFWAINVLNRNSSSASGLEMKQIRRQREGRKEGTFIQAFIESMKKRKFESEADIVSEEWKPTI